MHIALVHYHLQSGGVTRVILHQLNALGAHGHQVVVLTGSPPPAGFPGVFRVVPGLQYEFARPAITPAELAAQMSAAAREALGKDPDVWHVHNHSLGKSLVLPGALSVLARQGRRLLMQIHDFAEDGRPGNFRVMLAEMAGGDRQALFRLLYPRADHLHYAVLNERDYRFLQAAGLDRPHLHLLPNPIDLGRTGEGQPEAIRSAAPLWLYPTRAIRRKNLGEFLLWSALAPPGQRFAVTSAPENPGEWKRYARWKDVAAELGLPLQFEAVGPAGPGFVELLHRAEAAITTSVAEGFGMAFLEPWHLGVPVCGRDLPEITAGFREDGIIVPWSYQRLEVPLSWPGAEQVRTAAWRGLRSTLADYGRSPGPDDLERLLTAWIHDGRVDYGRLHEPMQEEILRRLAKDQGLAVDLDPSALPDPEVLHRPMTVNRSLLRSRYHLAGYGMAVEQVYTRIVASAYTSLDSLDGESLLDCFLAPERLFLLRVD
ncbi:glycosyltransferase family 4 protein [Desulfobulbus alkaliphilus]|uniref:glycosyltransferase family 4 protein n=1 Tax=Desulfobulbus alkaliphilus TaxID=869814 RepID=UPI001966BD3F|nr:glycosyltransferase family 4 protein [Desulfobulbus alkaliphilus]MBM9538257.1 glycosyltransferase family 4 protein [Desulfobulbus alkaliphilus]